MQEPVCLQYRELLVHLPDPSSLKHQGPLLPLPRDHCLPRHPLFPFLTPRISRIFSILSLIPWPNLLGLEHPMSLPAPTPYVPSGSMAVTNP